MNRREPRAPGGPSAARIRSHSAWSRESWRFWRDLPAAYAQGIYANPGRHGALIRFSSTSGHMGTDAQLGTGLGFAIKIFDVAGPKLVEDEPDSTTFDLVLKNNPTFIAIRRATICSSRRSPTTSALPRARQGRLPRALDGLPHGQRHARAARLGMGRVARVRESGDPDAGEQPAADHVFDDGLRCATGTTSPRYVSLQLRRAPRM